MKIKPMRQEPFTRSIAVGSEGFIRSVQQAMGIRAVGRCVYGTSAVGYQLKESIAGYESTNSDRTEEDNLDIAITNALAWKWEDGLE